jgi:tRNA(fMet)-specific endonuclease VapC
LKYLLDTDTCIFAMRRRSGVLERLLQESPDDVAVSAMTEAELAFGAIRSSDPPRAGAQVSAFLAPMAVLPFDSAAARRHAEIRHQVRQKPIGERDMVTAAVAAVNRLVLVTHNTKEFARVKGLGLEDWVVS